MVRRHIPEEDMLNGTSTSGMKQETKKTFKSVYTSPLAEDTKSANQRPFCCLTFLVGVFQENPDSYSG